MAKQVPWNEEIYMTFCKLGMLSQVEREILRMRIMGFGVIETGLELGISESSVNRTIARLKAKYDKVQPLAPDKLPVRRTSAKETWMDSH